MKKKYSKEEIKKALEQANANIGLEEVVVPSKINDNNKVLKKVFYDERKRRSN